MSKHPETYFIKVSLPPLYTSPSLQGLADYLEDYQISGLDIDQRCGGVFYYKSNNYIQTSEGFENDKCGGCFGALMSYYFRCEPTNVTEGWCMAKPFNKLEGKIEVTCFDQGRSALIKYMTEKGYIKCSDRVKEIVQKIIDGDADNCEHNVYYERFVANDSELTLLFRDEIEKLTGKKVSYRWSPFGTEDWPISCYKVVRSLANKFEPREEEISNDKLSETKTEELCVL